MLENWGELIIPMLGQLALAVVVLFVGLRVIRWLMNFLSQKMDTSKVDPSLRTFIVPLVRTVLQVLLVISVASMLGAEMTSFIAVLGAASFAVGLALQGSLSNFAGGVLILLLKPFKVGDFIEASGFMGSVKEIQVFYTVLNTPDNRKIIIPNANLSNSSAVNFSAYPTRRIEWKFGVAYESDIIKVKELLLTMVTEHPKLLDEPAPMVVLSEHADSALVFTVRAWANAGDFWPTYFEMMEKVKLAFDENDISIPFPQMDVHMDK